MMTRGRGIKGASLLLNPKVVDAIDETTGRTRRDVALLLRLRYVFCTLPWQLVGILVFCLVYFLLVANGIMRGAEGTTCSSGEKR